jgi:glycolate oxidase
MIDEKPKTLSPAIIDELKAICGPERTLTSPEDLVAYSYDATWMENQPQVVVLPKSAQEISGILKLANRYRIPVAPRGAGSGLSGGSVPQQGGIALSLTLMNRILEIDRDNSVAVVEPGVITFALQKEVEKHHLFYPPDPSSLKQSAIGGNIAENAGGARCLKYGVTSDYVRALEVVLPTGEIIQTGGKMVKIATGYNLRHLFVGAEGTLGIITKITLRLIPLPKFRRSAVATFHSVEEASVAVTRIMESGLLPASIELMDNMTIRCVEEYKPAGLPLDAGAMLLFALDGNYEQIVISETEAVAQICRDAGASGVRVAADESENDKLWEARRAVSPALARRRPNKLGEDVSVPRSELPELVRGIAEISRRYNLPIPVFGHAGDGNLHPNILCDRSDPEEMTRVREAAAEIFRLAVRLGGTLSGEHGIGLLKKEFMEVALGAEQVELMRRLKATFDPNGILNSGKLFPTGQNSW